MTVAAPRPLTERQRAQVSDDDDDRMEPQVSGHLCVRVIIGRRIDAMAAAAATRVSDKTQDPRLQSSSSFVRLRCNYVRGGGFGGSGGHKWLA